MGCFFFFARNLITFTRVKTSRTINMRKHKSTSHPCSVPSLLWENLRLPWCMLLLRAMRSSCTTRRHLSWGGTCPLQQQALAPSSPLKVSSRSYNNRISTFSKSKQSIRQKLMLLSLLWSATSEEHMAPNWVISITALSSIFLTAQSKSDATPSANAPEWPFPLEPFTRRSPADLGALATERCRSLETLPSAAPGSTSHGEREHERAGWGW